MYDISYVVKWSSAFKKHKNALGSCNKYNSFDQHDQNLIHLNIPLVPVVQCPAYFLHSYLIPLWPFFLHSVDIYIHIVMDYWIANFGLMV